MQQRLSRCGVRCLGGLACTVPALDGDKFHFPGHGEVMSAGSLSQGDPTSASPILFNAIAPVVCLVIATVVEVHEHGLPRPAIAVRHLLQGCVSTVGVFQETPTYLPLQNSTSVVD